jgi:hypothetical protein
LVGNILLMANPQVHQFFSTAEAYDATQTDESIRDGDVLIVQTENVAGVLVKALPVAVTPGAGALHTLAEGATWATFEGGRYAANAALALQLSRVLETSRNERGQP